MLRPTEVSENCGTCPAAAIAFLPPLLLLDLPVLELDFALAELLEDFALLELDFTLLETGFTELLEEMLELDDTGGSELLDATLELFGVAVHLADTDKSSDTVAGISVTMSLPHFQPAKE